LIEPFDDKHIGKYGIFYRILFDLDVVHFPLEARIRLAEYVAVEHCIRTEHFILFEPCLFGIWRRFKREREREVLQVNFVELNLLIS
jgi:hypothetical protein